MLRRFSYFERRPCNAASTANKLLYKMGAAKVSNKLERMK